MKRAKGTGSPAIEIEVEDPKPATITTPRDSRGTSHSSKRKRLLAEEHEDKENRAREEEAEITTTKDILDAKQIEAARSWNDILKPRSPPHWREMWDGIVEMRKDRTAPVDTMGCGYLADTSTNAAVQFPLLSPQLVFVYNFPFLIRLNLKTHRSNDIRH